jgi:folate-binding protein YgfZ
VKDDRGSATPAPAGVFGRLPHLGILRFSGPEAISFLQGQVCNDVRRLESGTPLLAAYSSAQGRVIAVLHLLPHSSGVMALLPRDVATLTLERLRKFVLRAKVKIEDVSDQYAVIGAYGAAAAARPGGPTLLLSDATGYREQDGVGIARVGAAIRSEASRYWVIRPTSGDAAVNEPAEQGSDGGAGDPQRLERDWRLADIRAGLPQVYAATSEQFVAQMLNLDLLDGISFTKGCYTGQEIIARAQHLGRIKRRMFRLRLPAGTWSIGQSVRLADGRSGRLTELASAGDEFEALAVLNLDPGALDADSVPSDALAASELPLPYALTTP